MAGKLTDKGFAEKAVKKAVDHNKGGKTPFPSPKLRQVKTEVMKVK